MRQILFALVFVLISTLCHATQVDEGNQALKERRFADAYRLLLPEARKGNTFAQYNVAFMLSNGFGVSRNEPEAAVWYAKAVEGGDVDAMVNLGLMYQEGNGVAQDHAHAFRLFQDAAAKGNAMAQNNVGAAYLLGRGAEKNEAKAAQWLQAAADAGNPAAQNSLAIMYFEGRGVPKNYELGSALLQKSASQRYAPAQQNLFKFTLDMATSGDLQAMHNAGANYMMGRGIEANVKEGLEWLTKAADRGFKQSQKTLAEIYARGAYGVKKDAEVAKYWQTKFASSPAQE